ncbi:MAG: hypothetical protein KDK33_14750 [Leptospiraceae bacterium]|nr:hypothetical protein [Leptospiraceae bacterium]
MALFASQCLAHPLTQSLGNGEDSNHTNELLALVLASSLCQPTLLGGNIVGCSLALNGDVSTPYGPAEGSSTAGDQDGIGNSAQFFVPLGLATNGTSLFVTESFGNDIREINLPGDLVITFAGPGPGSSVSGDTDATGNSARFNAPGAVTTDGTNLYIAELTNNKIRKIDLSTGVVTTLAGPAEGAQTSGDADGIGNSARFTSPSGITTDGTSLYVADADNNKIRKIDIGTGLVTTFAGPVAGDQSPGDLDGTGNAARFSAPAAITTDGVNLYVADKGNNKIRKIVIATAEVTTIAGPAEGSTSSGRTNGTGNAARFNGPAGIATDGTNLYVSDSANDVIRKVVISTAVVTQIAGNVIYGDDDGNGVNASFHSPHGITTDGRYLYVVDKSNNKIRKIQ